jgi:transposase-like protein
VDKLSGDVEADETYIGGKGRNMHRERLQNIGTGGLGKEIVMGLLERKGKVRLKHISNAKRQTVQGEIRQHVAKGSNVFTDALRSYNGLNQDYVHEVIDHAREYVRGNVHTNGLENFWSLLKRAIRGTYVITSTLLRVEAFILSSLSLPSFCFCGLSDTPLRAGLFRPSAQILFSA